MSGDVILSRAKADVLRELAQNTVATGEHIIPLSLQYPGKLSGKIKWGSTILRKLEREGLAHRIYRSKTNEPSTFEITEEGREWLKENA